LRWQDTVDEGVASAVDPQGNLVLTKADGTRVTPVAGEVTLQVWPNPLAPFPKGKGETAT
jgi:biotin-(acetyl-CoA carboxylase) ligase